MECGGTLSAAVCRSNCSGSEISFMATCNQVSKTGSTERQRARSASADRARCEPLTPEVPGDRCCLGGYHDNTDGSFNVGVQVHSYVELAHVTDGAVRQTHFSFGHFHAGGGQGVSDVVSTDGTEQLAFIASGGGDGHFQLSQLSSTSFSRSFLLGSQFFQLSATL